MKNADQAFAVLRLDSYANGTYNLTIKEIVWSLDEAEKEIKRLAEINGHKGCTYFWQPTRVRKKDESQLLHK